MAKGMMLRFAAREVAVNHDRRSGKFYVGVTFCPGPDEMWETVTHAARFADKGRADALAARVRAAGKLDLGFWRWAPSVCSPLAFMQEEPAAKVYDA